MEVIIIVSLAVATVSSACYAFYQLGHFVGAARERERRDALEARVMERLQIVARGDREIWETEIDA